MNNGCILFYHLIYRSTSFYYQQTTLFIAIPCTLYILLLRFRGAILDAVSADLHSATCRGGWAAGNGIIGMDGGWVVHVRNDLLYCSFFFLLLIYVSKTMDNEWIILLSQS